jgi:hypothetical protein
MKDKELRPKKVFGGYDTVDYSHKDVNELLVQLHGQIMCLRTSI